MPRTSHHSAALPLPGPTCSPTVGSGRTGVLPESPKTSAARPLSHVDRGSAGWRLERAGAVRCAETGRAVPADAGVAPLRGGAGPVRAGGHVVERPGVL